MTQIVDKTIYIPDTTGHANLLDPFRTFCPDKCFNEVLSPLVTSDYSLINVKVEAKPKGSPDFIGQSFGKAKLTRQLQIPQCEKLSFQRTSEFGFSGLSPLYLNGSTWPCIILSQNPLVHAGICYS